MSETASEVAPGSLSSAAGRRPSLTSLVEILFCAIAGTASEVFLKMGAARTASRPNAIPWLGFSGLESGWVWMGIIFTLIGFLIWMRILRAVPLSIAFTLSNVIHVFVPVSCWVFLHETISTRRWMGIALVLAGLVIVARPFARLDQKIEEAL